MTAAMDMVGVPDTERGPWVQTYSGAKFYPLDPQPLEVDPFDIAIALSNLCRYTGHVRYFYSVAQHCVLCCDHAVAQFGDEELARVMLLHDATEAYLGDVSRPLKSILPRYRDLEENLWCAIADRFAVPRELSERVKEIDNVLLSIEKAALLPNAGEWPGVPSVEPGQFIVWTPTLAHRHWLERFAALFPYDMSIRPAH